MKRLIIAAFLPFIIMLAGCGTPDLRSANAAYRAGDYAVAKTHYEDLAARGFPVAQARMGDIALKEGKIDAAERYFTTAQNAGYAAADYGLGQVYQAQGLKDKAEKAYKNALKRGQTGAFNRIFSLYKTDDPARALSWYYRAQAAGVAGIDEKTASFEKRLKPEEIARAQSLAAEKI